MALEGAALQLGMEFGLKGIWETGVFIYKGLSGSDCKKLEQIVNSLSPIVTDICMSRPESLPNSSLQKFSKFREKIAEGNRLIEEYKKSRMPWRLLQINERVKKLEKSINKFIQTDLQIVMLHVQVYISRLQVGMVKAQVSISTQLDNVNERVEVVCGQMQAMCKEVETVREKLETMCVGVETVGGAVETVRDGVETGVRSLHQAVDTVHQEVKHLKFKIEEQQIERSQQDESLCCPPDTPSGFLGFDKHTMNLKNLLLGDAVNVVGVTAMGGAGKSTLAKAVCKDEDIRERFKGRVIYIVASERPDLLSILKEMWRNIVGSSEPHFTNAEDAHNKLESQIKLIKKPTLVVLDDISSKLHLEKLLFEEKQY